MGLGRGVWVCSIIAQLIGLLISRLTPRDRYSIQVTTQVQGVHVSLGMGTFGPLSHGVEGGPGGRGIPWGRTHHQAFKDVFPHQIGISVFADDLPEASNAVTLDDTKTDSNGIPAAKVTYNLGETPVKCWTRARIKPDRYSTPPALRK